MLYGILDHTEEDRLGSSLTVTAAVGDAAITVDWTVDFGQEGTFTLAGELYDYDTVDSDRSIIGIADGDTIRVSAAVGDEVGVVTSVAEESVVWKAFVLLPDADQPQPVVVPLGMRRYYTLGDNQQGTVVPVDTASNGDMFIADAPGRASEETVLVVPEDGAVNFKGQFMLYNGITAPANRPRVGNTWSDPGTHIQRVDAFGDAVDPTQPLSGNERSLFIVDSTHWLLSASLFGGLIEIVDPTTGGNAGLFALPSGFSPIGGVVKIGTAYYVLGFDSNRSYNWYVYKYSATFTKLLEWQFTPLGTGPKFPTLALNGSNLLIAYWTTAGGSQNRVLATTFTPDTGAQVGSSILCDDAGPKVDLCGAYLGSADFGATHLVAVGETSMRVFSITGTTGTRAPTKEWTRPNGDLSHGLAWDGTHLWVLGYNGGKLWKLTRNVVATPRVIESTLYDSNGAGTGTHETDSSRTTHYTQPPREWLRVEVDPPLFSGGLDEADSVRIYIDDHLQPDLGSGVTSAVYDTPDTAGIAAPSGNGFAGAGAPGEFLSAAADALGHIIELFGSGDGLLGPLGFSADRGPVEVLTGADVITMATNWSLTSASVQRFGCWVQGMVVFTRTTSTLSVTDGTADLANTAVGTLADGLRPAINLGGHSGSAGRNAAYDIAPTGVISLAAVAGPDDITSGDTLSVGFGYFAVPPA